MSKKKIIIIAVVALIAVGAVFSDGGSVDSMEEGKKVAQEVAQEYLSGWDYEIEDGTTGTLPKLSFEADIGERCDGHVARRYAEGEITWEQAMEEEIDVYFYRVYGGGDLTGLWVSEDGRVIGLVGGDPYRLL